MKETFLIHKDYQDMIDTLTDEQAGIFLKATMRYVFEDAEPEFDDQAIRLTFIMVRKYIDRMTEKYERMCAVNRENGSKGGRPKKTEENPEKPTGFYVKPNETEAEPKKPLCEDVKCDSNNIYINNNSEKTEKASGFDENPEKPNGKKSLPAYPHLPAELSCQELEDVWMEFRAMRQRMRKPMTRRAEEMLLKDLLELSGGNTGTAIRIVEQSVKNGYQGLFPLREAKDRREEKSSRKHAPWESHDDRGEDYDKVAYDLFVQSIKQDALTAAQAVAM